MSALSTIEKMRLAQRQNRKAIRDARGNPRASQIARRAVAEKRKDLRARYGEKMGPFRCLGTFLQDVHRIGTGHPITKELENYDKEYREYRGKALEQYKGKAFASGMNESILSDGGVFVPPQFANELLMRIYENDLLSRVRLFNQLTGNTLMIPAIDESSRANGSRFGGITSYWRQEGPPSALTASKPKEQYVELKVETLYVFATATTELLEDYPALETFLSDVVAQEFQFKVGDALTNGDGVGKPQGWMNSSSKKVIAAESGQAPGTILADNVFNMWQSMWLGCRKNMIWTICNRAWGQLMKMTVGSIPIFLPNHSADGAPFPTLLGRPVLETEFNQDIGTQGDIVALDPTTILCATKGDVRSFSSMHVYFDRALHAFRFEMRIDAKSWWKSALTMMYGSSNTTSNIVTLASR